MGNKIKQMSKTIFFTFYQNGIRKGIRISFAALLIVAMSIVAVSCSIYGSKMNQKNSVNYDGINYVLQENNGLNLNGYNTLYEGIAEICEKAGTYRKADVYKIKGLSQSDWIYLDNNSMLSTDDPYGGIYRSSKVKMDTIADFKPDHLIISYLTSPTTEQSGTAIQVFDTEDLKNIEQIVAAIENGKAVSAEKQDEISKSMLYGESGYKNYLLEFSSESYPNLVYRLNYAESEDGKFYIGYYGDAASYKIVEIDNTLNDYLLTKTSSLE